ncbi:unnamed protein product [Rhizophagus irregularis]|nr:unnamed protein product [Rhizophagus irregularis]
MTTNFQIINMYFLKIITKLIYYIKYGPSKVKIFRTSDYDLNKDERKEKYENYYILCEKCIQEINKRDYNCKDCYNKETDPNEKIRMRLGSCKECHQVNKYSFGCLSCIVKHFKKDFDKWTSGNEAIDKLILENQLSFNNYNDLLEWIPYNKFESIKYIAEGGFAKVYSAEWIDGRIKRWNPLSNSWERSGKIKIALKILNDSENISENFLNEIKVLIKASYPGIVKCFGITQEPISLNYALVLEYVKNDLRSYLYQNNNNSITWGQKLNIIKRICYGLHIIHDMELIHKDLHPGNILTDVVTLISDFGCCIPANITSSDSYIYGVMQYMAPEILRGKQHTLASDIYSLGIIINEIITITPPFNNQPHDHFLALDICQGLRPNTIRTETIKTSYSLNFLKELNELIEECWDANPKNRPTSKEICDISLDILNNYTNQKQVEEQKNPSSNFDETINITLNLSNTIKTHSQPIYTSKILELPSYLPEPTNCPNQQEFVSSRIAQTVQSEKFNDPQSECLECIIKDR